MEGIARVRACYGDGTAQVSILRQSACSGDCHKCSGCGAPQQELLVTAVNAAGARPGEKVIFRSDSKPVLAAAAVLYLMPLGLFFLGYLAGEVLWQLGGILGCTAFVAGIVLAVIYDRRVAKKQNTVYTITGYPDVPAWETHTKGDNDLD